MSQYLGRGMTSRGRMTITPALSTVVSTVPYLRDPHDTEAVIQGIKNLQAALKNVKNLTWNYPDANTTVEDFVNNVRLLLSSVPPPPPAWQSPLPTPAVMISSDWLANRCSSRTRTAGRTTGWARPSWAATTAG